MIDPNEFRLGRLHTIGHVVKALSKTLRAMASGKISTEDGARLCNGLGVLRATLETKRDEVIQARIEKLIELVQARKIGEGGHMPFNGRLPLQIEHRSDDEVR